MLLTSYGRGSVRVALPMLTQVFGIVNRRRPRQRRVTIALASFKAGPSCPYTCPESSGPATACRSRRSPVARFRAWLALSLLLGLLLTPTRTAGQVPPPYVAGDPCPEPNNVLANACSPG